MKVVICEDDQQIARKIETYIEKYAFIEENAIEVVLNTPNPFVVMKYIKTQHVDCFFIDMDLGTSMNGLELAIEIRRDFPFASIIFVTTHSEMLPLTFKYYVEALDFIIKDEITDLQQSTLKALSTAYIKYNEIGKEKALNCFQIKVGEFTKNIEYTDIISFKAAEVSHKVVLSTIIGKFEFYDTLNAIESYNKKFFRCHRGYIINVSNIAEIHWKRKIILMKDGEAIPISFRRLKSLQNILVKDNGVCGYTDSEG